MENRNDCLGKIPFTAVVAFVLVLTGGCLCAGTLYCAIGETRDIFRINFMEMTRIAYLQIVELVICATAVIWAVLMIAFSIVVHRRSRDRTCYAQRGDWMSGSRKSSVCFLWSSFVLLVSWILLIIVIAAPTLTWMMINSVCDHELAGVYLGPGVRHPGLHENSIPLSPYWQNADYRPEVFYRGGQTQLDGHPRAVIGGILQPGVPPVLAKAKDSVVTQLGIGRSESFYYVFNLTAYGIYLQPWKYPELLNIRETIQTPARFKSFCASIKSAGSLYGCGLGGAVLVTIGLALFMTVMASNRTRLRLLQEHADYRQSASIRRSKDNVDGF